MAKKIEAFKSLDGKIFESEEACKKYEAEANAKVDISIWVTTFVKGMNSGHRDHIVEAIFKHAPELLRAIENIL